MDVNRSLHDELESEARHLPLGSTSIEVIIETAGRRRRRRNVGAVGGVLALTAVTVVGIQQLSRVDEAATPLQSPDTVLPVSSTSVLESAPSTVPRPQQVSADLTGAVPAALSTPVMTWTMIDADGPEALALRYGGADERYALATEPGGTQPARRALYEQRDGEWVRVTSDVLPEGLAQATISGDAIYAVGTAPATAGEPPGSVGRYDIAAEEWARLPLPEDARPYRSDAVQTSVDMSITALDDGALVVVNRGAPFADYRVVSDALGGDRSAYDWRWVDGALEVSLDCDQAGIDQDIVTTEQDHMSDAEFQEIYRRAVTANCTILSFSADELGLSTADEAELGRPAHIMAFRFDGDGLTPVDLPDPSAQGAWLYRNVLTTWSLEGQRSWFVHPDASFEPVFQQLGADGGISPQAHDGVLSAGVAGVIVTGEPGAEPMLVDLSPIVVDATMVNPTTWIQSVASNLSATVAAVTVDYQRTGSITEPTTIEGSDYNLVVDPDNGVTVVERSSGRTLSSEYRLATEPGRLKLISYSGDELFLTSPTSTVVGPTATIPPITVSEGQGRAEQVLDEFIVDWSTLAPWSHAHQVSIASSVDGHSYAVESFAELVGATAGESAEVNRVEIVDGRFLVYGWVWDGTGNTRPVILIGTPTT